MLGLQLSTNAVFAESRVLGEPVMRKRYNKNNGASHGYNPAQARLRLVHK